MKTARQIIAAWFRAQELYQVNAEIAGDSLQDALEDAGYRIVPKLTADAIPEFNSINELKKRNWAINHSKDRK